MEIHFAMIANVSAGYCSQNSNTKFVQQTFFVVSTTTLVSIAQAPFELPPLVSIKNVTKSVSISITHYNAARTCCGGTVHFDSGGGCCWM